MKLVTFFISLSLLTLPLFAMNPKMQEPKPMIIIMLGAPGAGKGTQAVRLSDRYQIPQISTGELFRENLRQGTEIGKKAKTYMEKGALVPDAIVLDMFFARASEPDCKNGYILDGFPRTIPQAEALDQRFAESQTTATIIALSLEVPDEAIVERLSGRTVCEKCGTPYHKTANPPKQEGVCDRDGGRLVQRDDDKEEVVRSRLRVFHEQTEPLKEYYQAKGNLICIDGNQSKEETNEQIDRALQKVFPQR
jgi:adenylate kinase